MKWIIGILPVALWFLLSIVVFSFAFYIMEMLDFQRATMAIVVGILSIACWFCSVFISKIIFKILSSSK